MDRGEFVQELQNALPRLYDYPHLESGALRAGLARGLVPPLSAAALSQAIVEAIERLKPPPELPAWSRPWRNYNYLSQRYVQLHSVKKISRTLGISERQSQRINAEAVEALAAELWPRLMEPRRGAPVRDSTPPLGGSDLGATGPAIARREVARLADASAGQHVHLGEVLAGVMATLANIVSDKNAPVVVDLPANLPPVVAERTLLRQGLLGLLVACLGSGVSHIALSGCDAGGGIDLRLRATAGANKGGGAGLYASISEDRSWRLAVEILHFQSSAVSLQQESPDVLLITAHFPSAEVPTVLVVDDNPDTIRLYRRYLGNHAYHVVEANSGSSALELARQLHPTVVTLDVMMPGQDGWETLQKLHNDPRTQDIPVIICTVIDQRDLALSLGAFDLLAKPVSRVALLQALDRCLAARAVR